MALIDLPETGCGADCALAKRHAPRLRFDAREPFLPGAVGYTVFRADGPSPSFPRDIALPEGMACAIEYAVWWDWDIQHLYELEHVWVYLDADGHVWHGEASWHGGYHVMEDANGALPLEDGRLVIYSEPGKHAFAPSPAWLLERAETTNRSCGRFAGIGGLLVTPLFEDALRAGRTPLADQLAHTYLERCAFEPAYAFDKVFDLAEAPFVPWAALEAWIPQRVNGWLAELATTIPPGARRVLRIAHRGASAYAQENSPAAIRKAAEVGADMVEIDIRATADDVPVVIHDFGLKRIFGVEGVVSDLTLAELRALTPPGCEPVPTFAEVVELCADLWVRLYLDIKQITETSGASMFETLDEHDMTDHAIFGAFRPDVLAEIKAHAPKAQTSILFNSAHVDPVLLAQSIHASYVHPCWGHLAPEPHKLLTADWLRRVRDAGLGVVTWHEQRPAEIAALKALGVSGICSDRPDLLL
ncbi:MAG: glycerophosphodiester phosphodiesterase [Anaerolineae bacterium]|nr:glycerophosphodiester phosphodiesterase [Anaerolineae bacterium]